MKTKLKTIFRCLTEFSIVTFTADTMCLLISRKALVVMLDYFPNVLF